MIWYVLGAVVWYLIGWWGSLWIVSLDRDILGTDVLFFSFVGLIGPFAVFISCLSNDYLRSKVIIRRRS